jgi:hypothetical protein
VTAMLGALVPDDGGAARLQTKFGFAARGREWGANKKRGCF